MPDDRSRDGHFEPIHEAHAIEQVSFVFQIDRPLDDATFSEVRAVTDQFQSELPGRVELQGFALTIGAPRPGGPVQSGPITGTMLRRTAPDGTIESELRVERESAIFRTTLYTRWDAVWACGRKYFEAVLQKYVAKASVSGIGLTYVDKFAWVGKAAECRQSLLLRPASKYLCPHIYAAQDLWHSHTGAFLRVDNATKRLLNVNVDCVDETGRTGLRRVVSITTVLTDLFNQPGYAPSRVTPADAGQFLDTHMRQLHAFNKEVISNTISDDMCRRIALTG